MFYAYAYMYTDHKKLRFRKVCLTGTVDVDRINMFSICSILNECSECAHFAKLHYFIFCVPNFSSHGHPLHLKSKPSIYANNGIVVSSMEKEKYVNNGQKNVGKQSFR